MISMAIEAPYSKFKKTNLKIYILIFIVLALWCAYDGYFNQQWIKDHTDANDNPETYLVVNRNAPSYLISAAVLLGLYLYTLRNKKIIADENELVISDKEKISYDSIEKIDKTNFEKKGHFTITYKDPDGKQTDLEISYKKYDNLEPVLEHLVSKIS